MSARASAFGLPGRIQAPNSKPRSIALVGLGSGGAAIARAISGENLANLDVHVLAKSAAGDNALAAIQAGGGDLQRALTTADMIFIVACRGDERTLKSVVELCGDNNFLWNTDYPHPDGTWPWALRKLDNQPIPAESKRKILWDTPARAFHLN